MTTNEAIEKVSRLKPNAVRDEDVAAWILELNRRLITETKAEVEEQPLTYPDDGDMELFADGGYEELYIFYAIANIEFYQREYSNYNNSVIMFNDRMSDFRRQFRRTHLPERGTEFTGVWW